MVRTVCSLGMIAKTVGMEIVQNAEKRPEGETGLGKTQVGLVRKQMEMKQAEVAKKKIGKSNWKQKHVLRLREKGDEYLGRSKKADKIPVPSFVRRCSR